MGDAPLNYFDALFRRAVCVSVHWEQCIQRAFPPDLKPARQLSTCNQWAGTPYRRHFRKETNEIRLKFNSPKHCCVITLFLRTSINFMWINKSKFGTQWIIVDNTGYQHTKIHLVVELISVMILSRWSLEIFNVKIQSENDHLFISIIQHIESKIYLSFISIVEIQPVSHYCLIGVYKSQGFNVWRQTSKKVLWCNCTCGISQNVSRSI